MNPESPMTAETVATQVVTGVIVAHVIEFLKKTKYFPWLDCHSTEVTRWISVGIAVLSALGITATATNHSLTLNWNIVDWKSAMDAFGPEFKAMVISWATQQAAYKGLIREQPAPNITFSPRPSSLPTEAQGGS